VRAPGEAGKGVVQIRLSVPDWKGGDVKPVTVEVPMR
jgi:hypothetical protein